MTIEDTQLTVGKTTFYQGENGTHPQAVRVCLQVA